MQNKRVTVLRALEENLVNFRRMDLQKIVDPIVSIEEKEEKQRKIFDGIHNFEF